MPSTTFQQVQDAKKAYLSAIDRYGSKSQQATDAGNQYRALFPRLSLVRLEPESAQASVPPSREEVGGPVRG